jgi:uncharacterized protein (DUF2236 family)
MDLLGLASKPRDLVKASWLRTVSADSLPGVQFSEPAGDPGLFGPGSAIWYVHSDVTTLVGGLSGLLLGALHQPTLYGTNQHSSYSDDPLARLGRTASFVNAMTWGSMPVVDRTCETVRKMHRHVQGTMPDGRSYSANASEQLIWTATTQAHSIMRAHLRYHPDPLSGPRIDEYYSQYAQFAIRLGADSPVPSSRDDVADYFAGMRPSLTYAEETAELAEFFRRPFGPDPLVFAASLVITRAAFETLPGWAKRLYGIGSTGLAGALPHRLETIATRQAARAVLAVLRWSLEEPPIQIEARRRSETLEAASAC